MNSTTTQESKNSSLFSSMLSPPHASQSSSQNSSRLQDHSTGLHVDNQSKAAVREYVVKDMSLGSGLAPNNNSSLVEALQPEKPQKRGGKNALLKDQNFLNYIN